MTERTPQDRAEFEAWMRDGYYANLATTGDFDEQRDRYREIADHMAWCAWRAARAAQPVGVPEGWADAYRAFLAAFDNPIARRRQDDDFSSDARRRMRDINEAMLAARPAAPAAEPECNYAEGGRESVDEALEIVESFGPGIQGVNDSFARQIILAAEVRRLREIYLMAVNGRSQFRRAYMEARKVPAAEIAYYRLALMEIAESRPLTATPTQFVKYLQDLARDALAAAPSPSPAPQEAQDRIAKLSSALNAMLTHFGMDEDEWSKPTFDQARAALTKQDGK